MPKAARALDRAKADLRRFLGRWGGAGAQKNRIIGLDLPPCAKDAGALFAERYEKCSRAFARSMEAVGEVGARYGTDLVYLHTDEVEHLVATKAFPRFRFFHLFGDVDRAISHLKGPTGSKFSDQVLQTIKWVGGTGFEAEAKRGNVTEAAAEFKDRSEWLKLLEDAQLREFLRVSLLAECDALLGPFAALEFQLAYQLAVGTQGHFPPFIALDGEPLRPPRVTGRLAGLGGGAPPPQPP